MPCENCLKPENLCICADLRPLSTRTHVLILQHPQEPDKELGSARLAHLSLPNSTMKVGLSWPNLKKALGREASSQKWAVLYLGSGIKEGNGAPKIRTSNSPLILVDRKGVPLENQAEALAGIEGIVFLDGTWSQAKALWWRNAWLLKLRRAVLLPPQKSLYKELRREPRKECLSTIESIAYSLDALNESPEASNGLTTLFQKLLNRYREQR